MNLLRPRLTAVLHQLDGFDHTGTMQVGVPAILGMNFQAVNIAQKFSGYVGAFGSQPDTVYFISSLKGKTPRPAAGDGTGTAANEEADEELHRLLESIAGAFGEGMLRRRGVEQRQQKPVRY